ncbi:pre-mRNA cleavage factor Im 25 kDa subunit 1 isoform X2 [Ricinus communis]|uniref:pre-mRNA cleavage factor Im 25 kDa subunit 1 isoform X2 n=1 Tax=Ricinus communis TaxID=3988 RepID=UPI000D69B9EE|nr:pre-mRNA cleavage factor Im 25 kDa subunit 1 isoform X2 [Ricinus communis]|eukprot:XP_015571671.2 pre-mRNA cleavage factor Im 25 kDa subunit 1 isoform X2 [Ricinus communis]
MSVSVKQDNATKSKTNVQQRAKASTIQGRTRTKLYKVHISKGHLLFSSVYFYLFIYCFFLFLSYFLVILRAKFEMGDHEVVVNNNHHEASRDQGFVLDIYPLSRYYFGSKDPLPFRDETLVDRVQRMKSNYLAHGLRTCVEAVILVELFKHPHLLLLQIKNSIFKLPGGRIRPGESDIGGLKRKLSRKLSNNQDQTDWEVGECLGMWWRPDFETLLYPYLPPNLKTPKTYGGIISGVPQLLSKYSFRIINS